MQTVIEVENLLFSYEKNPVLQNISCKVKKGQCIGIIGPNGGGKTTLLKLLMGFLRPQSGLITIYGKSPKEMRQKIGYVPQANRYDKAFPITVNELILMGAISFASWLGKYPASIKKKAEELCAQLGLSSYKNKPFGSLSGGLAQRALIARALLSDPEILFLDEPTANIDPKAQKEILEWIFSLKGSRTILLVTHDLNTIVKNVERIFCIQTEMSEYLPKEVCEHFALGLYHSPLIEKKE